MLAHKVVRVLSSAVLALALVAAPYKVTFDFLEPHAQTASAKDGGKGGGSGGGNTGNGGGNSGNKGGGYAGGSKGGGNAGGTSGNKRGGETSRSMAPQWKFDTRTE